MFAESVYEVLKRVPKGKVTTYKALARAIGKPRAARAVGNALNKNPFPSTEVPCHRVVLSNGFVGGFASGTRAKIRILTKEGIPVVNGRIPKSFILHKL